MPRCSSLLPALLGLESPDAADQPVFASTGFSAMTRVGSHKLTEDESKKSRTRFLPDNIYDAIRLFKASPFAKQIFGEVVHNKFAELKTASAERCPKSLGSKVKTNEIQFHHEITNQYLWNQF